MFQTALVFLSLPVMARLLTPAEFGLVALAMSFVWFTMALADAGMGQSLVRTPASETDVWSSAFWMITGLAGALSLFLLAIAWPMAWIFGQPQLALLIAALAPVPLMQGMLAPAIADLQQRECFTQLAAAEIAGAISGLTAAVLLALGGYGAWALVAQQLAMWVAKALVIGFSTRFRPRLVLRREGLAPHLRFGAETAGWSLVNFLSRQIDPMVIARLIGMTSLGLYSMANRLASLPGHLVGGPAQSTLYTRMVALRHDLPALKSLVLIATRALAGFVFVPMMMLCVAASAFVEVFLSERWTAAAPLLAVMAPVGAVQAVTCLNGALLMAVGRTDLRLRLTVEFTLIWLCALPLLALQGLNAVVIGYAVVFLLYLPRTCQLFLRPIDCTLREYAGAIAVPAAVACAVALAHVVLRAQLAPPAPVEIVLAACEIVAGYGVLTLIMRGALRRDLKTVRRLFTSPLFQK